jgi:cytochrome c biogenesis protein CcdA
LPRPQWQIVIADVSMSLDNVLAVAGAAHGHPTVLIIGLILSIALMGLAASWIARLLNKHRWIAYVGLLIILYVATEDDVGRLARGRADGPGVAGLTTERQACRILRKQGSGGVSERAGAATASALRFSGGDRLPFQARPPVAACGDIAGEPRWS